jgi:putative ABC transport system ATP-binding protein
MTAAERVVFRDAAQWLAEIIGPDRAYLRLAIVYGVAISLLSLATPISVQLLINSVAYTAQPTALWTLSTILFLLLLLVAALSAFRVHLMALFERRVFARVVAEVTVRAVHAQNPFFSDAKRDHLFNRFFDLTVVQKAIPSLFIGGFTILLQSAVGLVITSFYHPFFLAFNGVLLLALLLIWLIWSRSSFSSAVALSHAKHDAARWLESVGGSNGFYKSSRHLNFAMDRSEAVTATYVDRHRRYFRYSFAQTLACLLLYALASAALLVLGGTLILRGELSIGQLVAAELILSGVFYGISQLGWYLDTFYDLVASSEELSLLYGIPQEDPPAASGQIPRDGAVRLRSVRIGGTFFDFDLAAGEQVVALAEPGVDRALAHVLKRHARIEGGLVTIGGSDLNGLDMYLLRSAVIVLDRPTIVEVTIREYLSLAAPDITGEAMLAVLDEVGLAARIARLPDGLDTLLASSGWPLSIGEVMELKLANALLSRPRLLILSPLFDLMEPGKLARVLASLRQAGTTVLLFTGRPEPLHPDRWMLMRHRGQEAFGTLSDLQQSSSAQEVINALPA